MENPRITRSAALTVVRAHAVDVLRQAWEVRHYPCPMVRAAARKNITAAVRRLARTT